MTLRLAIVVSHPIQHFAPWHREVAKVDGVDLKVFFCCDWGTETYYDADFQSEFKWDVPLLNGYEHEFLPIAKRPEQLTYRQVDNPEVGNSLDHFKPDVVKVFGYAHKTSWRVADWAEKNRKPLLLYSDSNGRAQTAGWKRVAKQFVVRRFYNKVDGALFVGDNNFEYHRRYGLPAQRLFRGSLPIDQSMLMRAVPDRASARRRIRDKHGIPQDAFVVMFCGKFSSNKRPVDVVAATHMVGKKGMPVWSMLVGEGRERANIEQYGSDNGVTNYALTGFVNQSRIAEYYAASDVLVISSQQDAHPLVVSEAGTFGLPAIVSDQIGCIGAQDTARPDVSAVVYRCGDQAALADSIEALFRDQVRYRSLSATAAEIARTQDVSVAASELVEAARELHQMGPR